MLLNKPILPGGGGTGGTTLQSSAGAYTVPIAVSVTDVVYGTGILAADRADNSALATSRVVGVVVAKPTTTTATIAYEGEVGGFVGLTPAATYFLGTAGGITATPPSTVGLYLRRLGVALNSSTLLFDPGIVIGL